MRSSAQSVCRRSNGRARVALALAMAVSLFALDADAEPAAAQPATAPASSRFIEISVVTAESKEPIANAQVSGNIVNDTDVAATPDAEGRFRIEVPSNADAYITISAKADGRMPMKASWPTDKPLPERFEIPLPAGAPIGGCVVDAENQPVAGATVVLAVRLDDIRPPLRSGVSYKKLTTDADGNWLLDSAAVGAKSISVGAYHLQRGGTDRGFFSMTNVAEQDKLDALRGRTFVSKLDPVRPIKGRVVDAAGNPIASASIATGTDRVASNSLPATKTDADGHFEIGGTPDANVPLTIAAKGYAPAVLNFRNTPDAQPVLSTLQPAQTLEARVVDADGKPIEKAWFVIEGVRGWRTLNVSLYTDADGRIRWAEAPAEAVSVDIMAKGFADRRSVQLTPGSPDNVIMMTRPVTFRGTVVDAETGQPIANFTPYIGIDFRDGSAPSFDRSGQYGQELEREGGSFQTTFSYPYPARVIRVEADGYAPADSSPVTMTDGDQQFEFKLHRDAGIAGSIHDQDGRPAAGVDIYLATKGSSLQLENGRPPEHALRNVVHVATKPDGTFNLHSQKEAFILVATGDAGFAQVTQDELKASPTIALRPWSRVEGTVHIGSKPAGGVKVYAWPAEGGYYEPDKPHVSSTLETIADASGRFSIDRVPPGKWSIGRYGEVGEQMWTTFGAESFEAAPGQTHTLALGNKGRPITGRIEIPAELKSRTDWTFDAVNLATHYDSPPVPWNPADIAKMTAEERKAFAESPEMKAYTEKVREIQSKVRGYSARVTGDGTFRFDDVIPGTYQLSGRIYQKPEGQTCGFGELIGTTPAQTVEVVAGEVDAPIESASLTVSLRQTVGVGDVAPAFAVPTLDGKQVSLADFQNKVVVLDFWATWCGPCVQEIPHLKAAYETFKADDRVAFISLSLDQNVEQPRKFVETEGLAWTQGFLGDWNASAVPNTYGVQGIPALFIIGTDGKVRAKNLRGEAIVPAIEQALEGVRKP